MRNDEMFQVTLPNGLISQERISVGSSITLHHQVSGYFDASGRKGSGRSVCIQYAGIKGITNSWSKRGPHLYGQELLSVSLAHLQKSLLADMDE